MQDKTAVSPLLRHWMYCSLALSRRHIMHQNEIQIIHGCNFHLFLTAHLKISTLRWLRDWWRHDKKMQSVLVSFLCGEATSDLWMPDKWVSNIDKPCGLRFCIGLKKLLYKNMYHRWFDALWCSGDVTLMRLISSWRCNSCLLFTKWTAFFKGFGNLPGGRLVSTLYW